MVALARHFDVVAVGAAPAEADLAELERACAAVERPRGALPSRAAPGSTGGRPARDHTGTLIGRSRSATLARLVADAVARHRPAAVQVETMYAVHYRQPGLPAVIDLPDVVSGLCEAAAAARPGRYVAARLQRATVARAERRLLAPFAAVLAINEDDAGRLRALGVDAVAIPLAVEVPGDDAIASAPLALPADVSSVSPRAVEILFVGSFRHLPNREAAAFIATRLLPALRRRALRCHVTIAGRGVQTLNAALGPHGDGSATLEYVADPPDLAPLYRGADIVIVPLAHGGGTKNKTLEAMAWGRCVVGSAQAFTGLPAGLHGAAFVETPLQASVMADTLARLTEDSTARERVGRAAREYVSRHHTQARVNLLVDQVYDRVLTPARSSSAPRPHGGATSPLPSPAQAP